MCKPSSASSRRGRLLRPHRRRDRPGRGAITRTLAARAGTSSPLSWTAGSPRAAAVSARSRHRRSSRCAEIRFDRQQLRPASASPSPATCPTTSPRRSCSSSPPAIVARSRSSHDAARGSRSRRLASRLARLRPALRHVQMYGPVESSSRCRPAPFRRRPRSTPRSFAGDSRHASPSSASTRTRFLRFVRQAFAQKRKTLANNLRAAGIAAGRDCKRDGPHWHQPPRPCRGVSPRNFAQLWKALYR